MKKSSKKKDFKKFSQKNVHRRRSKEKSIKELARALEEVNMSTEGVKFKVALDRGRGGRVSSKRRYDEINAVGVFSSSKSGFGFVKLEGCERDIFIPEDRCGGAIDGDLVEIIYHKYERLGEERTEGRVKRIVSYGRDSYIGTAVYGTLSRKNRRYAASMTFIPDDSRVTLRPLILDSAGACDGDKVEVVIDRSSSSYIPTCNVIKVFGNADSKEANYGAILSEVGITVDFTPEELAEAQSLASEPVSLNGRADKTKKIIFTMDGAGAKDLDDAVSLESLKGGGWRLGVHIADVSHYVREKTALDRCAMSRGTSVYFTDKVVPMLPPALSNGACSLNAGERKYAISAEIELSADGEIEALELTPSVIISKVRGVYSEVNAIIDGTADAALTEKYKAVLPALKRMLKLYNILKEKSEKRGALDFDADEAEILLNESGEPAEIIKRERGISERIIEQFMLLANEAVARELTRRQIPCVYRIHAEPPADKFSDFVDYVYRLGFDTKLISKNDVTPMALSKLLSEADRRGMLYPVSYAMLRSMSKAEYSKSLEKHFGLGLTHYCHFTSPIRRLADLAVHRIIHRVIFEGKRAELYSSYAGRAAAAATDAELRAVDAERKIENLYKVIYMSRFIGEEFDARICSVTSFGMFCALDNTCEGLIPLGTMSGMFYFDEKSITMRSRDKVYRLADCVRVRLTEASIRDGKLAFELVAAEEESSE